MTETNQPMRAQGTHVFIYFAQLKVTTKQRSCKMHSNQSSNLLFISIRQLESLVHILVQ